MREIVRLEMRKMTRSLRGKEEDKSMATALGGDGYGEWWWSSWRNRPWRLGALKRKWGWVFTRR
jgi:hypothetical protein